EGDAHEHDRHGERVGHGRSHPRGLPFRMVAVPVRQIEAGEPAPAVRAPDRCAGDVLGAVRAGASVNVHGCPPRGSTRAKGREFTAESPSTSSSQIDGSTVTEVRQYG